MLIAVFLVILYLTLEVVYIKISTRIQIVDTPTERSSHRFTTIRGGGIIFPIAFLVPLFFQTFPKWQLFSFSLFAISVLSFIDDIKSLNSKFRLIVQSVIVIGLLIPFSSQISVYLLVLAFISVTGIINVYNFMDGINGITALYSLITISSLFWVDWYIIELAPGIFFISLLASLLAFSFFNVRKKAICFAGDVGSVSIAFIICFLLLKLIINTTSILWLIFLGIYGIDTLFTIFCRVMRKEPLMEAHRTHFYQYLVNELKWNHLTVSVFYAIAQAVLNITIIYSYLNDALWVPILILFAFLIIYSIFRFRLEGSKRLFISYNPD